MPDTLTHYFLNVIYIMLRLVINHGDDDIDVIVEVKVSEDNE